MTLIWISVVTVKWFHPKLSKPKQSFIHFTRSTICNCVYYCIRASNLILCHSFFTKIKPSLALIVFTTLIKMFQVSKQHLQWVYGKRITRKRWMKGVICSCWILTAELHSEPEGKLWSKENMKKNKEYVYSKQRFVSPCRFCFSYTRLCHQWNLTMCECTKERTVACLCNQSQERRV